MHRVIPSYPFLTVLAALGAAFGTLFYSAGLSIWWCALPLLAFILLLLLIPFIPWLTPAQPHSQTDPSLSSARLQLAIPTILLIISAFPVIFFLYSAERVRMHHDLDGLDKLVGKRILFCATFAGYSNAQHKWMLLDTSRMIFPDQRPLNLRISGFTDDYWAAPGADLQTGDTAIFDARVLEQSHWKDQASGKKAGAATPLICRIYAIKPMSQPSPSLLPSYVVAQKNIDALAQTARQQMVSVHAANIGQAEGGLLSSMVIGDKAVNLDGQLVKQFREVGLAHILAASGFNLTIVTAMAYVLIRLFCKQPVVVSIFCLASVLGFVVLAGPSASVLRAALMCALVLGAKCFCRSTDVLAVLGAALLLTLIIDPSAITDIGLQLSYCATATIVLLSKPLGQRLYKGGNRLLQGLLETVAVVLSSQAGVLPIQLAHFGKAGLMFLPANLAVSPLIAPITVFGFASSIISLVVKILPAPLCHLGSNICRALDLASYWPIAFLMKVVNVLCRCGGNEAFGAPSVPAIATYYLLTFGLMCSFRKGKMLGLALLAYGLGLFTLLYRPNLEQTMVAVWSNTLVVASRGRNALAVRIGNDAPAVAGSPSGAQTTPACADLPSAVGNLLTHEGIRLVGDAPLSKPEGASPSRPSATAWLSDVVISRYGQNGIFLVTDDVTVCLAALDRPFDALPCLSYSPKPVVLVCYLKSRSHASPLMTGNKHGLDDSLSTKLGLLMRAVKPTTLILVGDWQKSERLLSQLNPRRGEPIKGVRIVCCSNGVITTSVPHFSTRYGAEENSGEAASRPSAGQSSPATGQDDRN